MTKIYICGAGDNDKTSESFVDTGKLMAQLKTLKCEVINPMNMAFTKMSWSDTLNNRLELLKASGIIYVLPNWKESVMARIELTVAMDMNKHTVFHPVSTTELKKIIQYM